MAESVLHHAPASQYLATVDRVEEMARLQDQARRRKSMLVFGPEGVGKTRLLQSFLQSQPFALYVGQPHSPREMMLTLVEDLRALSKRDLRLPPDPKSLSTSSLKGIIQRTLDQYRLFPARARPPFPDLRAL